MKLTADTITDPTKVECPTCHAWVGWACNGRDYGYHAAGYHPARQRLAEILNTRNAAEVEG